MILFWGYVPECWYVSMLDLVLAMFYEFLGAWYYACWSWYVLVLVPWWTSVNYKNSGYHGIYINIFCCKMFLYFYCRYSHGSSSKQCQANLTYDLVSEHKRHYARCPIFVIARIFFFIHTYIYIYIVTRVYGLWLVIIQVSNTWNMHCCLASIQ